MRKPVLWIRPEPTAKDEALLKALASRGLSLATMNGHETVARFYRPQDVSALVVDTRLLDVACRFRDDSTGAEESHLPLLALSRESDLQSRLNALRHGADAFFASPLAADEVAAKLAQLLGVTSAQPCRVVVVDDDPSQADFAAAILSKAGSEVCTVTESLKTLDTLRSFKPELILMDLYMPDASGLELTAIIREQKELMDIPIVYLSGEHDPDKQLDALRVGGEDFLTKPISPKLLVATVRNRIDRSRQLHERISESRRQEGDPALARKHVLEQMEKLHNSSKAAGKATGLLYVEIDNPLLLLERVNLDGIDQVMSSIMRLSREVAHSEDRISRFGDFCLVLIAQRERLEQLRELAQQIKLAVDSYHFSATKILVNTTVSIGIRLLENFDGIVPDLINDAIKACYQARTEGKGGILTHHGVIKQVGQAHTGVQDDDLLDWITDPANLQLVYQPIVPLQREHGALYQCLLQLRSADGRLLKASEFLPAVEQTGRILKLDRWVIIRVLVTLHKLRQEHTRSPTLMISQSASALKDLQRIPWIEESMAKTRIKGKALALEFPFPEITADPQGARDYLASLCQLGIGISLNCTRELDALLQDLNLLPAHYIKITENQIRNYPDTWVRLVNAAHDLGKRIIVSRIEHPELLGQLWSNDVDYIQGNFVQPPEKEFNYDFTGAVLI